MKRIMIAVRHNPEVFAGLFRSELPGHDIVLNVPDDDRPTAYVVVGVPPSGLLARLHGLEVVLSLNAGVEHLLASGELPQDVPVVRMVDPGLVEGMVQWVAARVLGWHRNLFGYRTQQAAAEWQPRRELLASERTVTILGAGALGSPVAAMLASFGFKTRVWSRTTHELAGVRCFAGRDQLPAAVDGADILVNLLPATAETADLVDYALLARMAPAGLLVNGGRGVTVVDSDLLKALDEGLLDCAALDVFRQEPLAADHPFWRHPKVFVTPHVAAITHARTSVAIMAENVRRYERGEPLRHVVDRLQGY